MINCFFIFSYLESFFFLMGAMMYPHSDLGLYEVEIFSQVCELFRSEPESSLGFYKPRIKSVRSNLCTNFWPEFLISNIVECCIIV